MTTNSREARRRKIMERGSDRLALITGRIQTLPPSSSFSSSPPPDPASHSEDTDLPSQPSISPDQIPKTHVPDQIPVFTPEIEEMWSAPSTGQNEYPTSQTRTHVPDQIPVFTPEIEERRSSSSTDQDESAPSTVQNESRPTSLSFEKPRLFTASRISGAIEASERIRIYISMAVAVLVVFSHLGFPLLGSKMVKALLGLRPLYLVLVTNVTLVLARIFDSGRQRHHRVPAGFGEGQTMSGSEYEWAERLGKALGIGLLGKKVLDALFMDCAVYAIIVVCGLSFAQ
ncbi:uncharacterized protein LOC103957497 isoform X1 [Pyrus x bretschneideri]|uniref:uncharacterized protein LOC103957497 isoform X1 n=1 Tax=Pyrus x bretschneideri TaxID=225117 RepID=UPI00202DC7A4|nr:uncharacterized protein LOC103957497 isoform X1 [Pyrus x bretschneideri]